MSKLIVTEFVSLDGVMEAPGGEPGYKHSGWVIDHIHPSHQQYKLEETLEAEALLIGRVTYAGFAEAWPEREGPFADKMNAMPKYVVSTTLSQQDLEWNNSTLIEGDVAEEVSKLKQGDGGPILVAGSRTLVHGLIEGDLVDEYRLMVFPVILGSGKRVFPDRDEKIPLKLADSQTFESGVQLNAYEAVRD
jgi:dihydrofolate reductase